MFNPGERAHEWDQELFPRPLRPPARRLLWLLLVAVLLTLALVVTRGIGIEAFR